MKTRVIKPVISEKSFQQASRGKYSFLVGVSTNKMQIKDEIEKIFKVNVISVNTFKKLGKVKKTKGVVGKRADFKKAIVTLDAKSKIDLFETEENKSTKKEKSRSKVDQPGSEKKENKKDNKDVSVSINKNK